MRYMIYFTVILVLCVGALICQNNYLADRNERLTAIGAEGFKTLVHLNRRIDTLEDSLTNRGSLCDRMLEDAGLLVLQEAQ